MDTDLVERIVGDRVSVAGLIGSGVDPHLFNASANDVTRQGNARLLVYSGFML